MATITRATVESRINPTLVLEKPESEDQQLTPVQFNPAVTTYTATSSPPGTRYYANEITFSSSGAQTETIDLTDWEDTEGETQDSSGLRVQEIRIQADSDNEGDVTVEGGDSDPYELFGSGNAIEVPPGGSAKHAFDDQLADIGTTSGVAATDIKVSGTGGDIVTIDMIIG